jgi:hypothetical protein
MENKKSDILKEKFSKFYSPSEHLAVDEVIVKFKGHVIFRQYIPKKHKRFGTKIYKLWRNWIHVYDRLFGQRQSALCNTWLQPTRVSELTKKIQEHGHKLYMVNYFSSPDLFDDLAAKQIFCCGTVRQQERHATGLKHQKNNTQTGWPSCADKVWRQQYYGGTNATYVFWQTYTRHQQRIISAIPMEGHKAANCGRL